MKAGRTMGAVGRKAYTVSPVYHPSVDSAPACRARARFVPNTLVDVEDVERRHRCQHASCARIWEQVDAWAEGAGSRSINDPAWELLTKMAEIERQWRGVQPRLSVAVKTARGIIEREVNRRLRQKGADPLPEVRT